MDIRVGHGYDAHRLIEGRKLILGGVTIPYKKGPIGHSDADVLLHAVMDALLGAACMGDIGKHFPDTQNQYKDISSIELLKQVKRILPNYSIVNIDATIIAQAPKLAPYLEEMKMNMMKVLDTANINIKATTTEEMGFEGRGEGISAHAVCILSHMLML